MQVVVLTLSTGNGHNIAAEGIKDYYTEMLDADVTIYDGYKSEFEGHYRPFINKLICNGYNFFIKYLPYLYGFFYNLAMKGSKICNIGEWFAKCNYLLLANYLEYMKPDIIVCTHLYMAQTLELIKKKEPKILEGVRIYNIITDYHVHPFWETTSPDLFLAGSEYVKDELIKRGISEDKVSTTGFPIRKQFWKVKADSNNKIQHVLVNLSNLNIKKNINIIKKLYKSNDYFRISVLCGNNKKLERKLSTLKGYDNHPIEIIRQTNNICELMRSCDVIITKPGCMITAEAMSLGLDIILTNPIPGQEKYNESYLVNHKYAMTLSKYCSLDSLLQMINKRKENEYEPRRRKIRFNRYSKF